jgi:hypothetical protein
VTSLDSRASPSRSPTGTPGAASALSLDSAGSSRLVGRMVSSKATTVKDYLASLPPERRVAVSKVRSVIRKNLPPGFEEGMQYGMIGYYVPLSRYPETYNRQPLTMAALASQKAYLSLYLMGVYWASTQTPSARAGLRRNIERPARSSTWANPVSVSNRSTTCRSTSSAEQSPNKTLTTSSPATKRPGPAPPESGRPNGQSRGQAKPRHVCETER